jgi:hypothetical protein
VFQQVRKGAAGHHRTYHVIRFTLSSRFGVTPRASPAEKSPRDHSLFVRENREYPQSPFL